MTLIERIDIDMLQVTNVGLRFGDKELYKDVNLKFTKGNC